MPTSVKPRQLVCHSPGVLRVIKYVPRDLVEHWPWTARRAYSRGLWPAPSSWSFTAAPSPRSHKYHDFLTSFGAAAPSLVDDASPSCRLSSRGAARLDELAKFSKACTGG
ncbi:hypothetical protein MRX96_012333 [Rhipicephalus microplus]